MKVTATVKKTVQERQYEPFGIELTIEKEVPDTANEKEEITLLSDSLQDMVDTIIRERMKGHR